jgi:cytochrome c peroxidase
MTRNAPSLYDVGFLPTVMWDGRFRSLEEQSLHPFSRNGEMGLDPDEAVEILANDAEYRRMFTSAFDSAPSADLVAAAIASYERSLVSGGSPFDHYLFAEEEDALSPIQKQGLDVFATRGGCLNCHDVFHPKFNPLGGGLALFTDFRFHNLGVGYFEGRMKDTGRYIVTRDAEDWGAFRTPTLRNVELTGPYMHDGSLKTLAEVVDFYNRGGNTNPNISPSIHPLYLSESDRLALVEFLRALTDPEAAKLAKESKPQERLSLQQ